jgi:putative addiction module antidote
MTLKVTTIGNSAGVILPKELLARLRVDKGDELYAVETPDGLRLTTCERFAGIRAGKTAAAVCLWRSTA